jgi:hypothetical protein
MNSKHLQLILRILLSAFFVFSAAAKLLPLEMFELKLINDGYGSWSNAKYIASALIALEVVMGLSVLSPWGRRRLIYPVVIAFMIIMTAVLLRQLYLFGNDSDCGCFGGLLSLSPLMSLLKNVIILFMLMYLQVKDTSRNENLGKVVLMLASVFMVFFASIVVLYPGSDFQKDDKATYAGQEASFKNYTTFSDGRHDLSKGEHLALFLSAGCDHCKELAMRLDVFEKEYNLPSAVFFLWGTEEKAREFFRVTHHPYPYTLLDVKQFFGFREKGFPKVYLLRDGVIVREWNYQSFTNEQLSKEFRKNHN